MTGCSASSPHRIPRCVSVLAVVLALFGACLLGGALLPFPALAQADSSRSEHPLGNEEPTRYEEIGWYKMTLIKFESGKSRTALSMIEKHWPPTSSQADAPVPAVVEIPQGPWDVIMIYALEKRPLEMKWKSPAELGELRKAFRTVLDEEEAAKTWKKCKRLIAESTSLVGFSGRHGHALTGRFSSSN